MGLYTHIAPSAQWPVIIASDNYLRRLRRDSVRENGANSIAAFRAKRRQLLHAVAKRHQIQNGPEPLSPEIPIQPTHIDVFPLVLHQMFDGGYQIGEKLALVDKNHVIFFYQI